MSMLAERKRKTKWVINPTKKPIWTTDSSGIKFGKELMEKMGWSAGKGLGSKEQGIQEPLRVSYKNDTKGMGFKGNDDDWIEHQDEFNVLLNQLRGNDNSAVETSEKNEVKSLEDKSKHSRARVHYQKFTRGKDLSRYSEKDLACILGLGKSKKEKSEPEETTKTEAGADGEYETSFGVTTINSGSIQDYFKKKLSFNKTKSNDSTKTTNKACENNNESSEYEKPVLQNIEQGEIESKDKKNKKKKHISQEDNSVCEVTETCIEGLTSTNVDVGLTENGVEERKGKKRKHKSKSSADIQEETDTLQINENVEEQKNCDVVEANNTEEIKIKKKKKKSRKDDDLDGNNEVIDIKKNECSFQDENISEPPIESESAEEKKSKKRKRNSEIETEGTVLVDETNSSLESGRIKHKKKKHKSNSGSESVELIETEEHLTNEKELCDDNCKGEIIVDQIEKKHKKKKKRVHNDESGLLYENHEAVTGNGNEQNQNGGFIYDENVLETTVKKHKKRKHKSKLEEEQMISEMTEDSHPAINYGDEIKEKHKKRKHKLKTDTLDKEEIKIVLEEVNDLESSKKPKKEKRKKRKDTCEKSDVNVSECIETISENTLNGDEPERLPVEIENDIERKKRKKDKKNKKLEVAEEGDFYLEKVEKKEKKQKAKLKDSNLEKYSTESTEKSNGCSDEIKRIVSDETKPEEKKKERKGKKKESENVEKCEEQISQAEAIELDANASTMEMEKAKEVQAQDLREVEKQPEEKISSPAVDTSDVQSVNNSGKVANSAGNGKKPVEEPFQYKSYTTQKVLDLICWADIKEFRGSNLGNVLGYGFKKEYLNKVKVS